jgi:hypothetical protein
MTARLTSAMRVSALVRRMQASGGHAMILAKGDATAGAILIALADRGRTSGLVERAPGTDGDRLFPVGPRDPDAPDAISDYVAGRRRRDPDLWVVELDGPAAPDIAQDLLL